MKHKFLILTAALACLLSCNKTPQPDTFPRESLYLGTVSVDYEDDVFNNENITVAFDPSEDGRTADIIIYKIKFVSKMPVRIDVTIPDVELRQTPEGLRFSCDDIAPLALGGEYPKYQVYDLQGTLSGKNLSFSLLFGSYPTRFNGVQQ